MKKSNMKSLIVWRTACILLFFTLITTHFSAALPARYTSTASGSDSARVAKFAGGTITAGTNDLDGVILTPELLPTSGTSYYAFTATFTVTFNESEVARNYTLNLKLTKAGTKDVTGFAPTFKCPAENLNTITGATDSPQLTTFSEFDLELNGVSGSYTNESGNDLTDITFSLDSTDNTNTQMIITAKHQAGESAKYIFKVVYFVPADALGIESSFLTCDLTCEQVD